MLFSQFETGSYTVNMPKNAVTSLELRELIVKLRNEDKHSIGDIANIVKKSKSVIHGILMKLVHVKQRNHLADLGKLLQERTDSLHFKLRKID